MVKNIRYTNIRRVLDSLHDHPMLADITLEQVIRYTLRFISIHGYPALYQDKEEEVSIHEFRGVLPCDLISITQVKDCDCGLCLRSITDTFSPTEPCHGELAFKTQGQIIFTSFPEGKVRISYKAIPVDEDGFPLLIDNETYLGCLEAYIKKQVFTIKFDQGKITAGVFNNTQTEYAWLAGQLQSEFTLPSLSEMESISRYVTSIIPSVRHFDNGFKNLGDREYIRKH